MDRSSSGSRLLEFHRANGIPDSRAHTPRVPKPQPASPPRHAVQGARPPLDDEQDHLWALPLAVIVVTLALIASILFAEPKQLPAPADAPGAAEVAK
jgi:hypothetical protein